MIKRSPLRNKILSAVFAFLSFCALSYAQQPFVERIVDGDTFKLSNGERVRLIGVDTPESKANAKAKRDSQRSQQDVKAITAMGKKAAKYLDWLMGLGLSVRMEFDVQKKDRYGRLLAYVFLVDNSGQGRQILPDADPFTPGAENFTPVYADDAIFVNATLIKAGYASPMTVPPNVRHADLFKELYREAREQKRGLWKE
ncbi:MAG TPA: thermonuclease family protein [Candidatus Omnitrophota bacterium]|nr:thermonuclease family protein [Candidatus Omnitrophota bacterium]